MSKIASEQSRWSADSEMIIERSRESRNKIYWDEILLLKRSYVQEKEKEREREKMRENRFSSWK